MKHLLVVNMNLNGPALLKMRSLMATVLIAAVNYYNLNMKLLVEQVNRVIMFFLATLVVRVAIQ
jgi:hypothetical protein